jgi:hypothetical protein
LLEKTVGNRTVHVLSENIHAQLENLGELLVHLGLEIQNFRFEDGAFGVERVFAFVYTLASTDANVWDEILP